MKVRQFSSAFRFNTCDFQMFTNDIVINKSTNIICILIMFIVLILLVTQA